jgi:hypothetical protein
MMLELSEKRFSDYLRGKAETGMGYWIATVRLKDGRVFPQAVIVGGCLTRIKGEAGIPFSREDIADLEITHDKWDWRGDD